MYIQIRKVIIRKLLRESLGKTLNWCTNLFIDAIAISPLVFNHCIWRSVLNSLGYINNLAMLIPLHMEKSFCFKHSFPFKVNFAFTKITYICFKNRFYLIVYHYVVPTLFIFNLWCYRWQGYQHYTLHDTWRKGGGHFIFTMLTSFSRKALHRD